MDRVARSSIRKIFVQAALQNQAEPAAVRAKATLPVAVVPGTKEGQLALLLVRVFRSLEWTA